MTSCFERAKFGPTECTTEDYDEALGAVPPAKYLKHGFVMGEPYDFERWFCFWFLGGRRWCALMTIPQAESVLWISQDGVTYNANWKDDHAET